jgi:probable selenium-dependent hydroxylase accessory protein YqeC
VPADLVRRLHATRGFRLTLVKADGARMRLIKAPNPGEPVLPPDPDVILPVVSVHAVGRPLDERIAHRVERLAAITGRTPGDILRPEDLATLLAHPEGALQRAGGATVVPVINAVDDPVRRQAAREAASGALDRTERFDRVVLATMIGPDPLVEVIERG